MKKNFVTIRHPKGKGQTARVTEQAFDDVWSSKGWELVREDDVNKPFNVATARLAELQAEAVSLELDPSGTVAELRERITEAQEG